MIPTLFDIKRVQPLLSFNSGGLGMVGKRVQLLYGNILTFLKSYIKIT